jgi:hypothetical protein
MVDYVELRTRRYHTKRYVGVKLQIMNQEKCIVMELTLSCRRSQKSFVIDVRIVNLLVKLVCQKPYHAPLITQSILLKLIASQLRCPRFPCLQVVNCKFANCSSIFWQQGSINLQIAKSDVLCPKRATFILWFF